MIDPPSFIYISEILEDFFHSFLTIQKGVKNYIFVLNIVNFKCEKLPHIENRWGKIGQP